MLNLLINPWTLVAFVGIIGITSLAISPKHITTTGFFQGTNQHGQPPRLFTLVLSQVTTWIFARSLMNAAILGYYYGFAGTLAYTCYYLSFLTGGFIVARLRADKATSVQHWLGQRFGRTGHYTYNLVVGLRLLSEVFANLIVVGLIFSAAWPTSAIAGNTAIIVLAIIGLIYSALGGLRASLRTDTMQMLVFLAAFGVAFALMITRSDFSFGAVLTAQGVSGDRAGWVLVVVALLQVLSYPAHDPVMMDRGFIADEKTTRDSFIWAFVLSVLCIFGFGMFGIQAGLMNVAYDTQLLGSWMEMFGGGVYLLIACSLLLSAISTLDSTLASSARLMVEELRMGARTVRNGRLAMCAFMAGGALLTLWNNATLFDAVAVSGTASMFLAPVFVFAFLGWVVPIWSYLIAWSAAVLGAVAYLCRGMDWVIMSINPVAGLWVDAGAMHKYDQLLGICICVLAVGFCAMIAGVLFNSKNH